jgi:hypothetical protein
MHKNATKCNETLSKWCKNKHGASKIIETFETYQWSEPDRESTNRKDRGRMAREGGVGSRRARELTYNTAYPP